MSRLPEPTDSLFCRLKLEKVEGRRKKSLEKVEGLAKKSLEKVAALCYSGHNSENGGEGRAMLKRKIEQRLVEWKNTRGASP